MKVSRWVSLLLFALVFLSELLCVDVQGFEGVNGKQHVSNVSLEKQGKYIQTKIALRENSLGCMNKSEDIIELECRGSSSTLET